MIQIKQFNLKINDDEDPLDSCRSSSLFNEIRKSSLPEKKNSKKK